ncbi:MAG: hypothetical protein H0V17_33955, partial [Deltaproteobacteria bacterium]|nr:hypothetical protein [Deltaproteobacteria bacterium]
MQGDLVALGVPTDVVDPDRLALQAALLAATDLRRFGAAVRVLSQRLDAAQAKLSSFDIGRHQHVCGLVAWRVDGAIFRATRALNASIRALSAGTERENRYLARVHDTFGQMLHQQGMLADALGEYRTSLALRDPERDRFGLAITHGNLGRLLMDVGNFREAAEHLAVDLGIIGELDGSTRLRAQLTSHLAECHLSLGAIAEAHELFSTSHALAAADDVASIFATLGL